MSRRKSRAALSVTLDHTAVWIGAKGEAEMRVGGEHVGRGGYIWIGEPGDTGRCIGHIGIGKFLRLARNIERRREASHGG